MASIPINSDFSMNGNAVRNVVIDARSTDPVSPVEGQVWENTTTHLLKYYNGTAVIVLGSSSAYTAITDGSTTTNASGASTITFAGGTGLAAAVSGNTVTFSFSATTGNGSVVLATSPTIVTPTIASFANANHGHTNSAGGGTLTHAAISDFDTQVRTSSLDQMTVPAADVSWNSHKITNLANASANGDVPNYGQVLALVNGQTWKDTVKLIAVSNITLSGEQTIDGVLTSSTRVAVVGQSTATQNGIYTSASGAWVRTSDFASGMSVAGATFFVEQGTTYADRIFTCTNSVGSDVVGTNNLTFVQTGGANSYIADESSLHLSGNTFSILSTWAGQTAITTLGTVSTGTWSATTIAINKGGTGQTTAAAARGTGGIGSATAPANATNVTVAAAGIGTMVQATITGTGSATAFTITHNLNNLFPIIGGLINGSTGAIEFAQIVGTDANTVTITFNAPVANAATYKITICG